MGALADAHGLSDAFLELQRSGRVNVAEHEHTWDWFSNPYNHPNRQPETQYKQLRLDVVYSRGLQAAGFELVGTREVFPGSRVCLSDHFGIRATFKPLSTG